MNTHKMQFGWIIEAPKYLSILTNQDGLVAIVSEYTTFGDNQSLLITLSETSAKVAVIKRLKYLPRHSMNNK